MARPRKYTAEELQEKIDQYFKEEEEPTMGGLAVHLKMSRAALIYYKEGDEFFNILKKAREKVESIYEKRLIYKPNPTGVIFALKNMGWKDAQSVEHSGDIIWNETKTYKK